MEPEQRILIVDNSDERRQQLRKLLEARSYGAVEAANCEDALELLKQLDIHLVLTETELPTMSGLFLLQKIKQAHPDIEVILLTNNASSFNLLQALRLGAYDFIVRPIDTGEILDKALERVFRHLALLRENAQLLAALELQNRSLQQSLQLLKALNASIEQVASAEDVIDVFTALLGSALKNVEAQRGFIALFDQAEKRLALKAGSGISKTVCGRYAKGIPPGLISHLFQKGKPLLVTGDLPPELFSVAHTTELSDLITPPGLIMAPLTFHERGVGLIVLSGQSEAGFNDHSLHFLIQLAHHACLVLEKAGEIYLLKKKINGTKK